MVFFLQDVISLMEGNSIISHLISLRAWIPGPISGAFRAVVYNRECFSWQPSHALHAMAEILESWSENSTQTRSFCCSELLKGLWGSNSLLLPAVCRRDLYFCVCLQHWCMRSMAVCALDVDVITYVTWLINLPASQNQCLTVVSLSSHESFPPQLKMLLCPIFSSFDLVRRSSRPKR